MYTLITVASLFKAWESDVKPHVYEMFGECQDSYVESWMAYLDTPLAHDKITTLQWAFAENYLQVAEYTDCWREEFSRLLTAVGVELTSMHISSSDPINGNTYEYVISRHGIGMNGFYTLPAKNGEPSRDDILEDLFLNWSEFEECQNDYSYYCQKYGLDDLEDDSKRLYDAAEKLFQSLPDFFAHTNTLSREEIMMGFSALAWKI